MGTSERVAAMFPIYEAADSDTARLKENFRSIAETLCAAQENATTDYAKRSFAEALTQLETASMFAVKGLHQG